MTETLSEIVEREAAEAEAENPDTPVEGGPAPSQEPESESEPAEPAEPKSSITVDAERDKRLKSEETRHENALKKIYGDAFEHRAFCPLCIGEGFLEPIPAGQQPDEIWEAVKALSGRLDTHELRVPDEYVVCERCAGIGLVGTPALNEHNASIPCKLCESRGYFDLSDAMQAAKLRGPIPTPEPAPFQPFTHWPDPTPAQPVQVISPPHGWDTSGKPGADSWGRWPGHPRFGIDPAANGGQW